MIEWTNIIQQGEGIDAHRPDSNEIKCEYLCEVYQYVKWLRGYYCFVPHVVGVRIGGWNMYILNSENE